MASRDKWKTDRKFLPGDSVYDMINMRNVKVVKTVSEDTVLVEFDGKKEEVSITSLQRTDR